MFDFGTVSTAPRCLAVRCLGAVVTLPDGDTVTTAHARFAGTAQ